MHRFKQALPIVTLLILAAMPTAAQSIFVSNDEWFTSQGALTLYNDTQLATNVAAWLTSQTTTKNILIVSNNFGLNNPGLRNLLTGLGYTVTQQVSAPSLATVSNYDAVFVSGDCTFYPLVFSTFSCSAGFAALDATLVNYVNSGGNVFVEAGLTCADDLAWNGFLNAFGLSLVHACNGILASQVNTATFQTQPPYGAGLFTGVNSVYIDNGENVQDLGTNCGVQIFQDANGNGLYGAWRPCCDHSTSVLLNGGFEQNSFNNWTTSGNFQFTQVVSGPFYVYSGAEEGTYYATLGPVGSDGALSQSFATTYGTTYNICFWLNAVGDSPSDISLFWDGILLFSQNNPTTGNHWTQYRLHAIGTGFDTIIFTFRDDPAWIALDNVSVSP